MKAFFDARQAAHDPKHFMANGALSPNPEQPERITRLHAGALAAGCAFETPLDAGIGPIAAVHTPQYLTFLQNIYTRWSRIEGAGEEVIPNVHPANRTDSYPLSAVGQAGYHQADTACPITADTYHAAYWSAQSAISGADYIAKTGKAAYALSRPPGHHAFGDMAGGFCFLNNSGIAAERLRVQGFRPAILDVDVHHGNGTQGMFYERSDVFTVSLHADPARFYPFFWGHAQERGQGLGLGWATISTYRCHAARMTRPTSRRSTRPSKALRPSAATRLSWLLALMPISKTPSKASPSPLQASARSAQPSRA